MVESNEWRGPVLRSTMTQEARLILSIEDAPTGAPADDEVVVQVEASPLHPSDLGLLLGPAEVATLRAAGTSARPTVEASLPLWAMPFVAGRIGASLAVGNEGAGTVVAAGSAAGGLLGRRVAALAGGMHGRYRRVPAADCVVLPEGVGAAEGAAMFVNPLTALAMVETARAGGHRSMIHTAAASTLGRMLLRLCREDGIALVNVVRGEAQVAMLRDLGAEHVVDSAAPGFDETLTDLVAATGAGLAFDAVGGGRLPDILLLAMERAASRGAGAYSLYGSGRPKQLYIYGALDPSPLVIGRGAGFAWSVSGFLVTHFLERSEPESRQRLVARVLAGISDIFASSFTETVTLRQLLDPDLLRAAQRKATNRKYLVDPSA